MGVRFILCEEWYFIEKLYKKIRAQADLLDKTIAKTLNYTDPVDCAEEIKLLVDAEFTLVTMLTTMLTPPREYKLPDGIDPESPEGKAMIEQYEYEEMKRMGGAL